MENSQERITQAEQGRQLMTMVTMIRTTCPATLSAEVLPLLDQLEKDQHRLDELLQQMSESPLIGVAPEDIQILEDQNRNRYEEHTALTEQMKETLGKVLILVQPK